MSRRLVVFAGLALSITPALAVYGVNVGPGSSDAVWNGVGRFGAGEFAASGVVINPNWVLTASHVVGSDFTVNGVTYTAVQRITHPSQDLALLRFNENLGPGYSLYNGSPLGQVVTMVGYGASANPRGDGTGYDLANASGQGTRRAVTNTADIQQQLQVDFGGSAGIRTSDYIFVDLDNPTAPAPYNSNWFGGATPTANEGSVWAGDSGGGWFINGQLVGITSIAIDRNFASGGTPPPGSFGHSGAGAVDLTIAGNRDWIASTVPEPGTMAALGLGAAALLRRRRSKK